MPVSDLPPVEHYIAPKPRIPLSKILLTIGIRFIFPPVLLWDFVKWGFNRWLGRFAGGIVLMAQHRKDKASGVEQGIMLGKILQADATLRRLTIRSDEGASLDTIDISFTPNYVVQPKFIIKFGGNGEFYEEGYESLIATAKEHQCHVIGFNFRGVGHSSIDGPRSKDDLVTDGIAQVQRLLDEGANPDFITLQGHSLGAGIATLVAKHFNDNGIKINLFNGSSFSSLTNVVAGQISISGGEVRTGHRESTGKKILAAIAWPFIRFGLALVNWEINAAAAYETLPQEYKEYMVVRSAKANRSDNILDDDVITHYGSLHVGIEGERKQEKAKIDAAIKAIDDIASHPLVADEAIRAREALVEARLLLKQRKMIVTNSEYAATRGAGHNLPHSELSDRRHGKSAVTFFNDFIRRTEAHHKRVAAAAAVVSPSRKI